ncbi:MAG: LPS assembly protein LptD [Phycisphaerales bacterium]|nr:LPS assembly protein LptD [Phycisphaerales bacterium]
MGSSIARLIGMIVAAGTTASVCHASIAASQAGSGDDEAIVSMRHAALLDGRSFSGVVLQQAVQQRDTTIRGNHAWSWVEGDTRRLHLDGDVRFTVGTDTFSANRGTFWIQPLHLPGRTLYQIAVYFDRVESPLAAAGISHEALGLLVTAVVEGDVSLTTDLLDEGRPDVAFVEEGERRFAGHLTQIVERAPVIEPPTITEPSPPLPPPHPPPLPEGRIEGGTPLVPGETTDPFAGPFRAPDASDAIFVDDGLITFSAEDLHILPDEEQPAIILTGGVMFHYMDIEPAKAKMRRLLLTAERAVIFLRRNEGASLLGTLRAGDVAGIYLEGAVTATGSVSGRYARTPTDAEYTLRGPHMYYDVTAQRAIVLDAVFSTFDRKLRQPIYIRARALRQEASNQWVAERATVANSAFFEPHFSIGASRLTVTQTERPTGPGGEAETHHFFQASNLALRAGSIPFFYWPYLQGEIDDIPLREISLSENRDKGFNIHTEWDAFTLLGLDRPEGVRAQLAVDWSEHRRVGFGLDAEYEWSRGRGELFTYYINDHGRDRFVGGIERDRAQDNRGMITARHRQQLAEQWSMLAELNYISDPAFLEVFFDRKAVTEKEFETQLELKNQKDNVAFTALVKPDLIDFTPNEYLLLSRGYQVEKLPELAYHRLGDLLGDTFSYTGDTSASRMRLSLTDMAPREIGLIYPWSAADLFGAAPAEKLTDRFRQLGYDDNYVHRFDTRHELTMPMSLGDLHVDPFITGRFTAYDDDFAAYGGETDTYRLWGAVGARASVVFQRVDDRVENRVFGLHRLRHLIEPNVTAWRAWTSIDAADLPVYDVDVESIAQGGALRLGVRNTLQTQRGGPGRWRSVDWIIVDTNLVLSDEQAGANPKIGRFIDYRPEYSALTDHVRNDAVWMVSDVLAISSHAIWDLDENKAARWSAGYELRHTSALSSFTEGRYVDALDQMFLDFGARYDLNHRYSANGRISFDTDEGDIREATLTLIRRAPQWTMNFSVRYNRIRDDTTFGIQFSPTGTGKRFGMDTGDLR